MATTRTAPLPTPEQMARQQAAMSACEAALVAYRERLQSMVPSRTTIFRNNPYR